MDFLFTPEQDEAAELAARILADKTTNERLKQVEAGGDRFDRDLWATLGNAFDWTELDLIMLARVVVECGKRVAPVPLATHAACVTVLREMGREIADGVYAAAVAEPRSHLPAEPTTTADRTDDGWVIRGTKTLVRAGTTADTFLVTATSPSGIDLFIVDADNPGVTISPQHTSDGDLAAMVEFGDAVLPDDAVVGDWAEGAADRLGQLLVALSAAEQLGVTEGALRLTAEYAKTREQFGRPIATFQAVSQRLADGFIDVLGQRLTLWQAIWRLQEGLPADTEVATAKLWAADAGHRIAHTTVHVHGGVGIDLDGEAHRYFTSGKRFEFLFGGATEQALAIGRSFA